MFTGRRVHETGFWDNAVGWDGVPRGWSHFFREKGVGFTSIGKLDFKPGSDHGIPHELFARPGDNPDFIHRKSPDISDLFRGQEDLRHRRYLREIRSTGTQDGFHRDVGADLRVRELALEWIRERRPRDGPWILNVNLWKPHSPWRPRREAWEHYDPLVELRALPAKYGQPPEDVHPYHRRIRERQCVAELSPEERRRTLVGYHATVEFVDESVGLVLDALEDEGLLDDTFVVYASDHGECCGAHGMWAKTSLYEDSARVPLLVMGPGVGRGLVEQSPVSLLDVFPTVSEAVGLDRPGTFRGLSLWGQLRGEADAPRRESIFSESHAGLPAGMFMVRSGRYKYVECVGERPILFDLERDPEELDDLVVSRPGDPELTAVADRLRRRVYEICSPEAVDRRAKADRVALRRELLETGELLRMLERRGYEPDPERLVPRGDAAEKR
jgi:choline-sulfatase